MEKVLVEKGPDIRFLLATLIHFIIFNQDLF